MGSPLGLAGIFFDLLARTHLQHSWSLHCLWLHLLLLDRSTDPFATFLVPALPLVAFAVARPVFDAPAKEQFAHHFLQEDRFGPEEIVPKWRNFLEGISTTPEQEISSYAELWHREVWLTVPKSCIALNSI